MKKKYILLLIIILFLGFIAGNVYGQRKQEQNLIKVSSVLADENGIPIPNAVISGKEGSVEVLTDSEGKFSIEVPVDSKLLIEAGGYENKVITVNSAVIKVTLTKTAFLMDRDNLINGAFGKVTKRKAVGAVNAINTKDIVNYDNSQYIYDAIRARIPGLLGNTNIRGIGNAVFIVDGFPRDVSDINLEEVEQISVLKDANASVLWGAKARNGVIIVTTKRGQIHKRKINVSFEQGMSKPVVLPKYLNSADYMHLYNEALENDGLPVAYADTTIAHYAEGSNPYRYPSIDYYSSEFLKSNKPFSKLLTEFSGGNDITQYYATVGWTHSGSLYAIGTGNDAKADRFNVRGNVDFKVNDYIKSFVDALVIIEGDKGPRGNFWSNASTLHPDYYSPLVPLDLVQHNVTKTGGTDLETAKIINGAYVLGGTSQYTDNVYGNMFLAGYTQSIRRTARFNTGLNIDLKGITEGLKLKTYLSLDVYNAYTESVENSYAVYQPTWTKYGNSDSISALNKVGTDIKTGVQKLGDGGYTRRFGTYAMLDYDRSFNDHSVAATFLGYFDNLNTDAVIIDEKAAHLALRVTYDYKKKYLVDFSSAYVNGFKLEKGNKGGFSPSLGLAWVIANDDLKTEKSVLNYLKIRASAGIVNYEFSGSNYRLYESTFVEGSNYSWADGTRIIAQTTISRSANNGLTFEKMKNANIGLEGYFFGRSLTLDANIFFTRNSGQVIRRSIYAPYVGNLYPYENYEATDYRGGELGMNWSKSIGKFSFDLGANVLIADSKASKRDELWSNDYQYRQGRRSDAIFGLEAIGLFADQPDINNSPSQKFGEVRPGDVKYKDQNNDNKIDEDDEIQIGNALANVSYGLTLRLKYKNLSLFATGNGRNGAESEYSGSYFWVQGSDKYSEEVLNRWTPETASTATYPRLTSKNSPNNFRTSTYWLYHDNYFTLDRVQLSFDVPKHIISKMASKNLMLYLRGENLARLSKDTDKRQLRIGTGPNYRSYALGLRIMF